MSLRAEPFVTRVSARASRRSACSARRAGCDRRPRLHGRSRGEGSRPRASWPSSLNISRIRESIGKLPPDGFEKREGVVESSPVHQGPAELCSDTDDASPIGALTMKPDRSLEEPLELTRNGPRRSLDMPARSKILGPISRVGGDRERLLEEADRQVMRSEGGGPLRRALERDPRLGGQGVALWALGSVSRAPRHIGPRAPLPVRPSRDFRISEPRQGGASSDPASRACCRQPPGSAPGRIRLV